MAIGRACPNVVKNWKGVLVSLVVCMHPVGSRLSRSTLKDAGPLLGSVECSIAIHETACRQAVADVDVRCR